MNYHDNSKYILNLSELINDNDKFGSGNLVESCDNIYDNVDTFSHHNEIYENEIYK